MRETGPKRAAWHAARARMIWRLHDELRQAEELESRTTTGVLDPEPNDPTPRPPAFIADLAPCTAACRAPV